jgi:hypothetical protein
MTLAAAVVLACGVEGGSGLESDPSDTPSLEVHAETLGPESDRSDAPSPEANAETLAASSPSVPPEPMTPPPGADVPDDSEPSPTLEDLLRLPASVGQVDGVAERLKPAKSQTDKRAEKGAEDRRLRLELEKRSDPAAVRGSTSLTRTEAGVSVEVGKTTTLRGGVRVEQESGKEAEEPVPTIGIEKRF